MLETVVEQQLVFYLVGAVIAIGIIAKMIAGISLKRLVKAASNMGKSNHSLMRLVRAKFEHACMVSDKVQNVRAFVEKYVYEYRTLGIRLHSWRQLEKTAIWMCGLFSAAGAGLAYYVEGVSGNVYQYGIVGAAGMLGLFLLNVMTDEQYQMEAAKTYMVDFLENTYAHRYEKANQKEIQVTVQKGISEETEKENVSGQMPETEPGVIPGNMPGTGPEIIPPQTPVTVPGTNPAYIPGVDPKPLPPTDPERQPLRAGASQNMKRAWQGQTAQETKTAASGYVQAVGTPQNAGNYRAAGNYAAPGNRGGAGNYGAPGNRGAAENYGVPGNRGAAGNYGVPGNIGTAGNYEATANQGAAENYVRTENYRSSGNYEQAENHRMTGEQVTAGVYEASQSSVASPENQERQEGQKEAKIREILEEFLA